MVAMMEFVVVCDLVITTVEQLADKKVSIWVELQVFGWVEAMVVQMENGMVVLKVALKVVLKVVWMGVSQAVLKEK